MPKDFDEALQDLVEAHLDKEERADIISSLRRMARDLEKETEEKPTKGDDYRLDDGDEE